MISHIKQNYVHLGLLWLRVLSGLGIMVHGYRKIFTGSIDGFINSVDAMGFPVPEFFAWFAALSEFVGGLLLAAGLWTRIVASLLIITMFVAAFVRNAGNSFYAREKALLYGVVFGAFIQAGAGKYSLDAIVRKWKSSKQQMK